MIIVDTIEDTGLMVSEVICVKCGHRWASIRRSHIKLKDLKCPHCGAGYVIETGQLVNEFPCNTCIKYSVGHRCLYGGPCIKQGYIYQE